MRQRGDGLRLKKVLNNNIVLAEDESHQECIVFGLGIAFKAQKEKEIREEWIERIFRNVQEKNQLQQMVESISVTYFDLASEIIAYVQEFLHLTLSNTIYITLTDHISYVDERAKKGLLPKNSLKWEIRQYYPKEYKCSLKIVELLEEELECKLNEDEAASIALHIINAELDNESMHDSMQTVQLMDQVMQIIRYQGRIREKDNDLNVQRLITHVKFFVQRVITGKQLQETNPLYAIVQKNYPDAYSLAEKVRQFVEKKLNYSVSDDEVTYLIIHLARVLERK